MSNKTVWIYDHKKNPKNAGIGGVPCRDLTEHDMRRFPAHTLQSIEACPFFVQPTPEEPEETEPTTAVDVDATEAPKKATKRTRRSKRSSATEDAQKADAPKA